MIPFSRGETEHKPKEFIRVSENAYLLTAENDTNTGVIVTDNQVMVIDTRATPLMAQEVNKYIRTVTDKPVTYVLLTHYHAGRTLGASAHEPQQIVASRGTWELIKERGQQDWESEVQRFPRLFTGAETIPGLTWPTLVFEDKLTVWMDGLEVQLLHPGRGHTKGDTVAWIPSQQVLFSGDLVEQRATPYCGDAYLQDWPETLNALRRLDPQKLVPGRGLPLLGASEVERVIAGTERFIKTLYASVAAGVSAGHSLKRVFDDTYAALQPEYGDWSIFEHCQSFNVSRCFDEISGIREPRIWTAQRDIEMWSELRGQ